MMQNAVEVAETLIRLGATDVLVGHVTNLAPRRIGQLRSTAAVGPLDQSENYDGFLQEYGEFNLVTVDVCRFMDAVEITAVNPDMALSAAARDDVEQDRLGRLAVYRNAGVSVIQNSLTLLCIADTLMYH